MSNQLANKPNDLRKFISGKEMSDQFAKALPKHLTVERFCRISCTALTKTPKLADCTQESLMACLLSLSAFGLEPDGRRAHLIPYGNQCTLVIDYKGLAELAMRSGIVSNLHADIVCENDVFEYNLGEIKEHKINFREPRGEMYAAYALCRFKDGTVKADVMNKEEIDAIRRRSRSGQSGPWVSDYNEMAKKTVFRRLSKWLPLSAEFRDATEKDDEEVELRDITPIPSASQSRLLKEVKQENQASPFERLSAMAEEAGIALNQVSEVTDRNGVTAAGEPPTDAQMLLIIDLFPKILDEIRKEAA